MGSFKEGQYGGNAISELRAVTGETNATILVVDDTPSNLNVLLPTLEQAGFDVLVATDGRQALQRAALGSLDLILLDIVMPGIDSASARVPGVGCRGLGLRSED